MKWLETYAKALKKPLTKLFTMQKIITSLFAVMLCSYAFAQKKYTDNDSITGKKLYADIMHMDSVLFNAFNAQDLATMSQVFDESLEFYHDKSGLTNYQQNIEAFKNMFAKDYKLTRELIKESVEVYPINGFGAVETGSHKFCHVENSKLDCGIFKFITIWQNKNGVWKATRLVSYGH